MFPAVGPVDMEPNNATVYAAIFTADNFEKYMNGTAYSALSYDNVTARWVNTNAPFAVDMASQGLPPGIIGVNTTGDFSTTYYIVVKNGESNTSISLDGTF